jgi:hypothetical protein
LSLCYPTEQWRIGERINSKRGRVKISVLDREIQEKRDELKGLAFAENDTIKKLRKTDHINYALY